MADITKETQLSNDYWLTEDYTLGDMVRGENFFNSPYSITDNVMSYNWKIASNLQHTIEQTIQILEDNEMNISVISGWQNPDFFDLSEIDTNNKHFSGEAIDIIVDNTGQNSFLSCIDVKELLGSRITELGLIFDQVSYIHLGIDGPHNRNQGNSTKLRTWTLDIPSGVKYDGLIPLRGI